MDDDIFFYYHFFFFCKHSFRVQSTTNNNKPIYGVWFICLCSSRPSWEDLFCTCKRLFTTYLTSTSQRITNLLWKDYISLKLVPTSTHIYKTVTFSPPSINDAVLPLIFSTSDWITYLFHWKRIVPHFISIYFIQKIILTNLVIFWLTTEKIIVILVYFLCMFKLFVTIFW